jgi:catechol 2,3-dioxygenase-like lactoylglutathione lyase family enzyme
LGDVGGGRKDRTAERRKEGKIWEKGENGETADLLFLKTIIMTPMHTTTKSIRPFLGAKAFEVSRQFYQDLGFEETVLSHNFSVFRMGQTAFYLQDAYDQDWIDNTQVFLEVADIESFWNNLQSLRLTEKYAGVRIEPIRTLEWGKECFIHDPSGILWHIGQFH